MVRGEGFEPLVGGGTGGIRTRNEISLLDYESRACNQYGVRSL